MSSSFNPSDLSEFLAVSTVSIFFLIVIGIVALIVIGTYVFCSIGLYRIAIKVGHESAWLAWIPFAQTWLLFNIPDQEFKVLIVNKVVQSRSNAFWIFIAINFGVPLVVGVLSPLAAIPLLNILIFMISSLVNIAMVVFRVCFLYPAYADLYKMFFEDSNSTVFAILSMFIPLAAPILLIVASGKPLRPITEIEQPYNVY